MRRLSVAMACVMAMGPCRAEWKPIPLPPIDSAARDPVFSVAAYGGGLWAMTSEGLFRSGDSGRAWRPARPDGFPRHPRLGSLRTGNLFSAGGCLYGTALSGLYFSCDGGATWKASAPDGTVPLSTVPRIDGDSAVMMAGETLADEAPFLSADRGLTWKKPATVFPDGRLLESIFANGQRLWSLAGGLPFVSDDGGKSWQEAPVQTSGAKYFAIHLGRLWAGGTSWYLSASPDAGSTWEDRHVTVPDIIGGLTDASLASAGGRLFTSGYDGNNIWAAGVFMSADTGKTWTPRNQGLPAYGGDPGRGEPGLADAAAVYALGNALLACTISNGIYRSDDLGAHWRASNAGISATAIQNRGPDRVHPYQDRVYIRTLGDAAYVWYVSSDTGRSWQTWNPGMPDLESLAFGQSAVYALRRTDSLMKDPVYRSLDGMKTWSPVRGPWESASFTYPLSILASGSHAYVLSEMTGGGYWHSADNGATWETEAGLESLCAFQWHAVIGNTLLQDGGFRINASTDSGRTWKASLRAGPIRGSARLDQTLLVLASDEGGAKHLYATQDTGRAWRQVLPRNAGAGVHGITAFGGRAYAATDSGLFVSRNGLDWEPLGEAGLTARGARLVAAAGDALMVSTGSGLYVSTDAGADWRACGLEKPGEVSWLAAWKGAFLAGKTTAGIWASTDTGRSWTRLGSAASLYGMASGPDKLVLESESPGTIQFLTDLNARTLTWSPFLGKQADYSSLALADGGLYLSKAEGGFVSAKPGAAWSAVSFPGSWPHDVLAGDGARLAVTAAEGIFLRGSAQSPWEPAEAGLPKDEVAALAFGGNALFAALTSQGLWKESELPIAIPNQRRETVLTGPLVIRTGADGGPVFRLRLARPVAIRLTLHAATGRTMATLSADASAGIRDLKPELRGRVALFYRLEIAPLDGAGGGRVYRGRLP